VNYFGFAVYALYIAYQVLFILGEMNSCFSFQITYLIARLLQVVPEEGKPEKVIKQKKKDSFLVKFFGEDNSLYVNSSLLHMLSYST
jgi:hypothetical protein